MTQAIVTKYIGPGNHTGASVRAKAQAGTVLVPWDHALGVAANHESAARALADKHGWLDDGSILVSGSMPDDTGYAFVMVLP